MKWMRRCWLSIIRRPKKTILLFLVAFAMGNLLAGSLGIIMTSEQIQDQIKADLGATANISGNLMDEGEWRIDYLDNKDTIDQYVSVVEELSNDERVATGEYHLLNDGVARIGAWYLNFTFCGTNVIEPSEFSEGKLKLTANKYNRYFTKEEIENGEHVAIVDLDLASYPALNGEKIPTGLTKIGNTITLSIPVYYEVEGSDGLDVYYHDVEFKVIGNYLNSTNTIGTRIYIPNKVLKTIVEEACGMAKSEGINGKVTFNSDYAGFTLKGIEGLEEFDAKAKSLLAELPKELKYLSSSDTYKRNAGPVENLNTVARVIFIASIVATVLILGLVVISFIIERKKEMGIYASIGERAHNIILQIMCEVLLVSTLAISSAAISGIFLGNKLSDYMLEVQRYVQREQSIGVIADLPVIYKPITEKTLFTRDEVIDNYEVNPDVEYFLTLYVVGEMAVIISCVLPLVYLTRLKPKDIMI